MRTISDINREQVWVEEDIPLPKHSGYRKVLAILDRMPPGSILEVGCGRGRLLEYLRAKGWRVRGLELQPQRAPYIVQADAGQPWPIEDQFDVVVAAEVIEHVVDTSGFLAQCRARLKRDGILILTTPNLLFGVNRVRMLFGLRPYFAYADWHVRMFVWSDLRKKIEQFFRIWEVRGSHVLVGVRHGEPFRVFSWLADIFPTLAAHFIVVARPKQTGPRSPAEQNAITS